MLNFVNHHRADPSASRSHQHFTTPNCCSLNNASNLDNNGQRHHILCRRMFLGHRTLLQKCTRSHRHRSRICQQQRTAALIPAGMHRSYTRRRNSQGHIQSATCHAPLSHTALPHDHRPYIGQPSGRRHRHAVPYRHIHHRQSVTANRHRSPPESRRQL